MKTQQLYFLGNVSSIKIIIELIFEWMNDIYVINNNNMISLYDKTFNKQ